MKYRVMIDDKAMKELSKMDKSTSAIILGWIKKNLVGTSNPRQHGKALVGNKKGLWRYRVGSYRLLAEIRDEKIEIYLVTIEHRRDIYN